MRNPIVNWTLRLIGWIAINSVLGTMNALLISFYSAEPFLRVFVTAQLTTHVLCILVESSMFTIGLYLYRLGERRNQSALFFGIALVVTALVAVAGVYLGELIHVELLGFQAYQTSRFYSVIFGSIILAIALTSLERFFRHLSETRYKAEQALQEARLQVLQERMRPHFLFNALNTIHSLLQSSPAAADNALLRLADSYRFLLGAAEKTLVPFDEEWEFCKNYVELMKIRFGSRLTVNLSKPDDTRSVKIPPLSLQPLIENAFRHGIQNVPGDATVTVLAARNADNFEITVRDTGPGSALEASESRTLANIRERLHFYFDRVQVDLKNHPGGGALATLKFKVE
ncbi:MAG: histidine kinase [Leptospirales bacterium]|nr:histidine kinase [Leptospirales bacterium]